MKIAAWFVPLTLSALVLWGLGIYFIVTTTLAIGGL